MPTPTPDSAANREIRHGSDADLQEHRRLVKRMLQPTKLTRQPTGVDELIASAIGSPQITPNAEAVDYNAAMVTQLQSPEAEAAFANVTGYATSPFNHLTANAQRQTQERLQWQRRQPFVVDEATRAIHAQRETIARAADV